MHCAGSSLKYVYRPVLHEACRSGGPAAAACSFHGAGPPLQLPGFGVEMAIKNMEYSALDDSKVKSCKTLTCGWAQGDDLRRMPADAASERVTRDAAAAASACSIPLLAALQAALARH
jgi:hypothetical protein